MTGPTGETIHATCISTEGIGVLLRGPSGAGKSDLALRLIDAGGAQLVGDDRIMLRLQDGAIRVRAAPLLSGKLEVRGVGIVDVPFTQETRLGLIVDLDAARVERIPEERHETILGLPVPAIILAPFEASAPAKLRLAARQVARHIRE